MTEEDFVELLRHTSLRDRARDAARLVYVKGMSKIDAANEMGMSKQRMNSIMESMQKAEQKHPISMPSINEQIGAIDASYAFAVKAARDQLGDQIDIVKPVSQPKMVGMVIARTDFHLVQSLGRGSVAVHELAKLDKVPAVGKSVAIQYENSQGTVVERARERGGHSR